tara:strand:- start:973 stop:1491 length:519 start_codon:yes stop_codon:yes gene_type:complete
MKGIKGKKGNFADVAHYMYLVIAFAITLGLTMVIINQINDQFQAQNESVIPEQVKNTSANLQSSFGGYWDMFFAFLLVIFVSFSVVMARLIPSSPKFIIISIVSLIILPFFALMLENIWDGFFQTTAINNAMNGLTFVPFILNNLTITVLIYSTIIAIALLTKTGETIDRGI